MKRQHQTGTVVETGRPTIRDKGTKVTIYLSEHIRDFGKRIAAEQNISLSELITKGLRGERLAMDQVELLGVGNIYVPATLLDPFYRDKLSAVVCEDPFTFRGMNYPRGAVALWWDTQPRPGDSVYCKNGDFAIFPCGRPIHGVIHTIMPLAGS